MFIVFRLRTTNGKVKVTIRRRNAEAAAATATEKHTHQITDKGQRTMTTNQNEIAPIASNLQQTTKNATELACTFHYLRMFYFASSIVRHGFDLLRC